MTHQTDTESPQPVAESPQPVAEAESLVGVASTDLFCLFANGFYYPEGGAMDFRGFGTVEELKELYAANINKWAAKNGNSPWGHICEHATMRIVCAVDPMRNGIYWQNVKVELPPNGGSESKKGVVGG